MILGNTIHFSAYTIDEAALGSLYDALHGQRVGIVSGEKSFAAVAGRMPRLDVCCHIRHGGECTMDAIHAAAEACSEAGADVILGIGGGKALDVAKAAGQLTSLPVYAVPTIAATCAAVTALSIVYHDDGKLDQFLLLDAPPAHAFLDTTVLACAPTRYFRAGLADCMAKHLECTFSMRGDTPDYVSNLGAEISRTIFEPLLKTGPDAYRSCEENAPSPAFDDALQRMIISTGMTSLLLHERYNGAIAHSLCYGLGAMEGVEKRILHGELVGYGSLVQLAIDGDMERLAALRAFLQAIGSPVTLRQMDIDAAGETLAPALSATLAGPDMKHLPYPVTREMLLAGIQQVEAL